MTCPDIHKLNLTCWTFEFEITPAHGTKLALAIGLCSTHPLCFRPDVGHQKYMAVGKVQAYTRLWDGILSLIISIHCISYVKTTCYKNCKNDNS